MVYVTKRLTLLLLTLTSILLRLVTLCKKKARYGVLFSKKSTYKADEILLRNMKSSLCSDEIATAMCRFVFTVSLANDFENDLRIYVSSLIRKIC